MSAADSDLEPPSDSLTPDRLPRLAAFLAGYLHDELARQGGSAARAAWELAAEADLDEVEELARDWQVLRAAARELPLAELNRLLRERFGSSWQASSGEEIDAVGVELERAIRD